MLAGIFKSVAPGHFAEVYKPSHDGRFHLYEARRGRGKSYTLTFWALEALAKGVPVVLNYELDLRYCAYELLRRGKYTNLVETYEFLGKNVKFLRCWDDVFLSYDCLVILDEVNRTFNGASGRNDAPQIAYEWLQQSRKFKQTIIFAAQGFDWLPPKVRQLADVLWRARREDDPKQIARGKRVPLRFYSYGGDPWAQGLGKAAQREADYKFQVPFQMRIASCYKSFAPVGGLDDEPSYKSMAVYWDILRDRGIIKLENKNYTLWDLPLELYCSTDMAQRESIRQKFSFISAHEGGRGSRDIGAGAPALEQLEPFELDLSF